MNLNCETILDLYTHKNKKVLCLIKVSPESGKKRTSCRFLSEELWNTFDEELEKIISTVDDWDNEKCHEFEIKSVIHVRVQKSNLSFKQFSQCLDTIGDSQTSNDTETAYEVLECQFNFQQKAPFRFSIESQDYERHTEASATELQDIIGISRLNNISCTQSDIRMLDSVINEDEIISRKNDKSLRRKLKQNIKRIKSLDNFSDEETTKEDVYQTVNFRIHKGRCKSDSVLLELNNDKTKEKQSIKKNYIKNREKQIQTQINKKKNYKICSLKEKNTILGREDKRSLIEDEVTESLTKKSNTVPKTPPIECLTDSTTDTSPQKERRERKVKSSSKDTIISVRRSERSPSKPKRFIYEQADLLVKRKSKKLKSSQKSKELFGTTDDEDDIFENATKNNNSSSKLKSSVIDTPVSKKPESWNSSSSTSTKKKRKRDKSSECQQEKRDISKWLSKKKLMPSEKEATKSLKIKTKTKSSKPLPLKSPVKMKKIKVDNNSENRSQSVTSSPITLELPSKEELELIRCKTKLTQKENARVRAELDKMRTTPPKKVEILSLQNMSVDDILDTFSTYKSELDEVYENNHKRDHIKGHDGINHCFVIRLLEQNIQMKMLEKLTKVYNNSKCTTQATLFANALLPEWIIRVYMEKFKFTREEAIDQVKAQEEYQLHMEEQNDNSFLFD